MVTSHKGRLSNMVCPWMLHYWLSTGFGGTLLEALLLISNAVITPIMNAEDSHSEINLFTIVYYWNFHTDNFPNWRPVPWTLVRLRKPPLMFFFLGPVGKLIVHEWQLFCGHYCMVVAHSSLGMVDACHLDLWVQLGVRHLGREGLGRYLNGKLRVLFGGVLVIKEVAFGLSQGF